MARASSRSALRTPTSLPTRSFLTRLGSGPRSRRLEAARGAAASTTSRPSSTGSKHTPEPAGTRSPVAALRNARTEIQVIYSGVEPPHSKSRIQVVLTSVEPLALKKCYRDEDRLKPGSSTQRYGGIRSPHFKKKPKGWVRI